MSACTEINKGNLFNIMFSEVEFDKFNIKAYLSLSLPRSFPIPLAPLLSLILSPQAENPHTAGFERPSFPLENSSFKFDGKNPPILLLDRNPPLGDAD